MNRRIDRERNPQAPTCGGELQTARRRFYSIEILSSPVLRKAKNSEVGGLL
jgi:hypothetical protein